MRRRGRVSGSDGSAAITGGFHPPFSFCQEQKENGPWTVQEKKSLRRVGPRKRVPPAAGGGRLALPRGSQGRKRVSLGVDQARGSPGYIFFLFPLALPWRGAKISISTRRGGPMCPPLPMSSSTTRQSASGARRTSLSTSTPRSAPDQQSRRKTHETEQTGASR